MGATEVSGAYEDRSRIFPRTACESFCAPTFTRPERIRTLTQTLEIHSSEFLPALGFDDARAARAVSNDLLRLLSAGEKFTDRAP
jgi:hypothetical protein